MKICITSSGPGMDADMDPRFGRCQYFLLVDPETMAFEAIENPNLGAAGGAGIQSAQLVANRGVQALITGQVGPNAYSTLQAAGVKIITGVSGTIKDVADRFKKGEFSAYTQGPTVQAHFGMRGGMGRGMGRGMGMGRTVQPPASSPAPQAASEDELKTLKDQSRQLKEQLDQITERIGKLETKK